MGQGCKHCQRKFNKEDEVVMTSAYGGRDLVHIECLHDYVLGASMQEYYDTYEDYLHENE